MALDLVRENLDGLSEEIAGHYSADDGGKFILQGNSHPEFAIENFSALKNSLGAARKDTTKAKDALKAFEGIKDPAAAISALAKIDDMANWTPPQEIEEKVKAQLDQARQKHKEELDGEKSTSSGYLKQLEATLIDNAATTAIAAAKGSVEALLPHVKARMKMRINDAGQMVSEVLQKDGVTPAIADGAGNSMTVTQLVDEFKHSDIFKPLFEGVGATGGGAAGGGSGNQTQQQSNGKVTVLAKSDAAGINANIKGLADGTVIIDSTR